MSVLSQQAPFDPCPRRPSPGCRPAGSPEQSIQVQSCCNGSNAIRYHASAASCRQCERRVLATARDELNGDNGNSDAPGSSNRNHGYTGRLSGPRKVGGAFPATTSGSTTAPSDTRS